KGGLGRGLAALIPTGPSTSTVSEVVIGGSDRTAAPPDAAQRATARPAPAKEAAPGSPYFTDLPVTQIRPNPKNPRTVFDEDALAELTHSIKEFGLLQPVVVRPVGDGFELV